MKDKVYIGELSKKLNISRRTILYYEDIGLIKSIREPVSNYRLYEESEIIKLQQIILFKKINLPLNEICRIINMKNSEYAINIFEKHLNKIDNEISDLSYSKKILKSFINITNKYGVENIDVIELLEDLTCINGKYEKIIGLNNWYEINLEICIGTSLIPIADIKSGGCLIENIKALRDELKRKMNIVLPLIRICDEEELGEYEYKIKLKDFIFIREEINIIQAKDNYDKCMLIIDSLKKFISNNVDLFRNKDIDGSANR